MQGNPAADWQQLTEHYRGISDEELEELAADFVDLTEMAQQVLRDEMRIRGLNEPRAPGEQPNRTNPPVAPRWASSVGPGTLNSQSNIPGGNEEDDAPREYTWKTQLCECENTDQAWQIHLALQRAGIESWVEQPGSRYAIGISYPRLMVAADQLEDAIRIVQQPIPQDIVCQSGQEVPEFEAPKCPQCGTPDPVLESVEPTNAWLCEACGSQWTEPEAACDEEKDKTGR
jgi:hypothetical protein